MAGFLRRKPKNQERDPAPTAEPSKGSSAAPIFARLATSLTSSGQRPRNGTSTSQSRAVSQPMTLGSTGSHRAVTLSRTSGEGGVNRRLSRDHDALGAPRQGAQAEKNAQTNAYRPQSGPQQAQVSRAASAAATTTPQRQAARLSRRVPALEDKPLPVPVPDDDPPPAAVRSNEQTPLTQRSLVSRLSHRAHPSQPTTSPPSAYETRAQQIKGRSVSIDSPRPVQENSAFDQRRSAPVSPPDPRSAFHQPLVPSPNFSLRRRMDDIRPSPRAEVNAGQHDLTSGSARGTVAPKHAIKPPHQTGHQQRNTDDVFHRASTVDEHVPSAYSLREEVSTLEPKVDNYYHPAPSSGQRNSYRSVSPTHIHANGLGGTNSTAVHHDTNLDRPLPSRPATAGQDSENGDVFVDASEEINSERRAEDAAPEITLYRDYSTKSLPSPSSSPNPNIPSIAEGQPSITQTPPLQAHKNPLATKGGDNMGATASFPDPQSSSPSKSGSRQKHLATTLTEGHKMRNGYQTHDYYNPYQDFGSTPQLMHTVGHVRGKPLIFAAMEANIDQQQPGEEQKVSVRLWDGQDRPIGPNMNGYVTTPAIQDHKLADGAPQNVTAGYPSPPSSEFSYPRAGKVDANQESSRKSSGTPTKSRKLSKPRHSSIDARHTSRPSTPAKARPLTPISGSRPATPAKTRPLTPVSPGSPRKSIVGNGLSAPSQVHVSLENEEPQLSVPPSRRGIRNSGMALLDVGEDPFAMTEGVRMVTPSLAAQEKETREKEKEQQEKDKEARRSKARNAEMSQERFEAGNVQLRKRTSIENDGDGVPLVNHVKSDAKSEHSIDRDERRISRSREPEAKKKNDVEARLLSTDSVDGRPKSQAKSDISSRNVPFPRIDSRKISSHFVEFISTTRLLGELLTYLSFYEWCTLASVSKHIRTKLVETVDLKEVVLERFLKTVGYVKWYWDGPDPLPLSLQDLSDYMFGVSTPTHEYARVADIYVKSLALHPTQRDPSLYDMVRRLTAATRSYSRIVLRLRAHAEKEAASRTLSSVAGRTGQSRPPSRASSPAHSTFSHGHSQYGQPNVTPGTGFRSPLFRPKRAPLLRVFVPSPDGDWLSDKSVLECEAECRRAGIMDMIRFGDVVWDAAVGDEGNVGKLVWDGSYLIDLDYSYSPVGDLPKYVPALAFPPSYFHKVIRTGPHSSNPIVHVDLSPWGEQIAANLQLLQDRVRTETPQGTFHNVVRWVNRSSFVIRSPTNSTRMRGSPTGRQGSLSPRIPIPDTHGLFVDPGWYGTVIVETESTNESLADLQDRCGPGVFPPRAQGVVGQMGINPAADAHKVFRILREKSRPGEIWIKTVSIKEKVLM